MRCWIMGSRQHLPYSRSTNRSMRHSKRRTRNAPKVLLSIDIHAIVTFSELRTHQLHSETLSIVNPNARINQDHRRIFLAATGLNFLSTSPAHAASRWRAVAGVESTPARQNPPERYGSSIPSSAFLWQQAVRPIQDSSAYQPPYTS